MERLGLQGIEVLPLASAESMEDSDGGDEKERAKAVYARTMGVVSELMGDVKLGRTLKMRRMKRVVQSILDSLLSAEHLLLGLTTIHSHDEYTYNHSVNVAILSMTIGQRIGLSKAQLVDLGIAGLFHDIGKANIPLEILNKPGAFTEDEWALMKRHPILGVKELLRLKGLDALAAHAICGVFEHHRLADGSGYPKVPYARSTSLFGRIVAIADCYDALTSSRVYRRVAQAPEAVLRYMVERAGEQFDAALLKLFVNAMGVFPIGTLCLLDSQELAVVVQSHPDSECWDRPRIRIVADASGTEVEGGLVDLADPHSTRKIEATVDARAYGIEVARYFL
jgi:HD-GYP domain-containing protein (c-di-GMP phosphodiesterase class II)